MDLLGLSEEKRCSLQPCGKRNLGDMHDDEGSQRPGRTISAERAAGFVKSGIVAPIMAWSLCQPDVFDKALGRPHRRTDEP